MATSTARHGPFGSGFQQLSPSIFYKTPPTSTQPSGECIAQEPHIILVTAWLNAATKHVDKYLGCLQRLFPTSRIVLITTTSVNFFQSSARRMQELQPAVDILSHVLPTEKVLLHSFSNAGATSAYLLAKAVRQQSGRALPVIKVVFDSAPGDSSCVSAARAFAVTLPHVRIVREICLAVLYLILGAIAFWKAATGYEDILELMRRGLNDPLLFPLSAGRLYIYSTADQMVPWQAVEAHSTRARSLGYRTYSLRLLTSGHVAHAVQHADRYWEAVKQLWNSDYLGGPGRVTVAW